jgi:LemA protein
LQDELTETENRIAVARRDYNEAVQTHNTYVRQFPQVITAKVIGADRKEPFEAPESAQGVPDVEFGRRGGN